MVGFHVDVFIFEVFPAFADAEPGVLVGDLLGGVPGGDAHGDGAGFALPELLGEDLLDVFFGILGHEYVADSAGGEHCDDDAEHYGHGEFFGDARMAYEKPEQHEDE